MAVLLVVLVVVAAVVGGYFLGVSNPRTSTVTTAAASYGILADCGFETSCSAVNPSGLLLTLSINTTSVRSNGSFLLRVSEINPTSHFVNLTKSSNWFLNSLPLFWMCSPDVYGVAIFRGYYTLQNISSAKNIILYNTNELFCPELSSVIGSFSVPPSYSQECFLHNGTMICSIDRLATSVYAIQGGTLKTGNESSQVYSLQSSEPGVFTIAAGDEWGTFALLHFFVVNEGS
jgi:hypothetical protein